MATVKINKKLVSVIKDKRKKKKLTQKDMAEYLQISFSNYQRLEANKYESYDQNLLKQIAIKLEIDDEIFSDTLKVSPTTKMALRIKNETLKQIKMIEIEHEFDSLSGGEKTKIMLAKLLLEEPKILLLDEPTNHLDLGALEWLETFLKNFKGTVLIVSHDRYFLDKVVNKVIELTPDGVEEYNGVI